MLVCWSSLHPDDVANLLALADDSSDVVATLTADHFCCVNCIRTQVYVREG
jgi:hypothetical protein